MLNSNLCLIPYQHLPLWAKVAIETLECRMNPRTAAALNSALDAYAKTYGAVPDDEIRAAANWHCFRKFKDYY